VPKRLKPIAVPSDLVEIAKAVAVAQLLTCLVLFTVTPQRYSALDPIIHALHAEPWIGAGPRAVALRRPRQAPARCDAYMAKPFSPRALLAKIREYAP
jgi:hypothetical protein